MPSYIVESYAAGSVVADQRDRARRTAELGSGIPYVRTTFLPGDETLLHLFEAMSPEEAALAAELDHERIVEAVEALGPPTRNGRRNERAGRYRSSESLKNPDL
jgi:hypothetical protein